MKNEIYRGGGARNDENWIANEFYIVAMRLTIANLNDLFIFAVAFLCIDRCYFFCCTWLFFSNKNGLEVSLPIKWGGGRKILLMKQWNE